MEKNKYCSDLKIEKPDQPQRTTYKKNNIKLISARRSVQSRTTHIYQASEDKYLPPRCLLNVLWRTQVLCCFSAVLGKGFDLQGAASRRRPLNEKFINRRSNDSFFGDWIWVLVRRWYGAIGSDRLLCWECRVYIIGYY